MKYPIERVRLKLQGSQKLKDADGWLNSSNNTWKVSSAWERLSRILTPYKWALKSIFNQFRLWRVLRGKEKTWSGSEQDFCRMDFFFLLNLGGFYLFSSFCHFRYQCFYLAELIYGSLLRLLLWNFQNGLFESFTLVNTSCRTACAGSRQPQKKSLCSK